MGFEDRGGGQELAGEGASHQFAASVVIPTYNRKDSLRRTLEGLSSQDYPLETLEVLVVSDGSTDGTDEFLKQYALQSAYTLRVIRQNNQGPSVARNTGVKSAAGEIIIFIDDDVEPQAGFLSSHMQHHQGDDKVVVIGPMSPDLAIRKSEPPWIVWEHEMLQKQYLNFKTGVWKTAGCNHFYTGNASLRREHILAVGGFDVEFKRQEDVELAYRMWRERDVHFVFDPKADVIHRPHRTFKSWLNVSASYGQCDVIRARAGKVSWDVVKNSYKLRNRATQFVARAVLRAPFLGAPTRALMTSTAVAIYRSGGVKAGLALLSMIYNVRYLESAQNEMGAKQMSALIFGLGEKAIATETRG